MHITLIGLPLSGKTTVFNALTGQREVVGPGAGRMEAHRAMVKVPDARLDWLAGLFRPRKVTPAEVCFVDLAGIPQGTARQGLPAPFLAAIGEADALIHVLRAFENPRAPHPAGSVDPERDLALLDDEFLLADLAVVERRLERLEQEIPKLPRSEKEARQHEHALLQRIKAALEEETPLRDLDILPEEEKILRGFNFLTLKPALILLNIGEERLGEGETLAQSLGTAYRHRRCAVAAMCAEWEMELGELAPEEAAEFRQALGLFEPAASRIIRLAYDLLGQITFFTFVSEEVRAWPLRRGSTAVEAAGTVHTDMARGFIRAEVVHFEALREAGSLPEARRRGTLRTEGRDYIVQDGDICTFLFTQPR
ncbi:MAG: redox-regulated ATPase YchF [Chloroflexia bacterium]